MTQAGRIRKPRNRRGWNAYRRWCGEDEPRVDQNRLEAYINHLAESHADRPKDMTELLYGLAAALRERDPGGDHRWVERAVREVWMKSPARRVRKDGPGRSASGLRRRVSLPVLDWPPSIRAAWEAARGVCKARMSIRDRMLSDNPARRWATTTAERREQEMGLYLAFCRSAAQPMVVSPDQVESYLRAKTDADCSVATVATAACKLALMSRALWPNDDWSWLWGHALELQTQAKDSPKARKKSARMRPVTELRDLAADLLARAEQAGPSRRSAALYQKGLIILFLTHHPVRRRNLHELCIGQAPGDARTGGFIDALPGGGFSLVWLDTKNGDPRVEPLAGDVVGPMERWLVFWRPTLVTELSGNALWLSACPGFIGSPLTPNGLSGCVRGITKTRFGLGIGSHLFRDITATAIVDHAPEHSAEIPILLGHRSSRSCQPYLEQASTVAAARTLEEVVERRINDGTTARDRSRRSSSRGRLTEKL